MTRQALLIIDVQKDYFHLGKCELVRPEEALIQINRLETLFLKRNLPILYIQHIKKNEDADFFAENSEGAELHPSLNLQKEALVITKHFPNSFLGTGLDDKLQALEVGQLVIAGMMTHMCVDSTVRAAKEKGYQPIVISDATATKDLFYKNQKIDASDVQLSFLAALQTFAVIDTAADFIRRSEAENSGAL
ncbi:cysteine hydrolase family protein [Streptococcus sp. H31]|uniref:cysteine hydrolase family protein n=1 Tax=Streptococcus huangxiaojuni TaxID=3237239 RepID=UPI0034A59F9D